MDVVVNKPLKSGYKKSFIYYCVASVSEQIKEGKSASEAEVNLSMLIVANNDNITSASG
jgi:hypothetical protein